MASGVYRHGSARLLDEFTITYHQVGKTANVDVLTSKQYVSIRTNGKSDASIALDPANPSPDEFTMALTAVLPLAFRPQSEVAAIIGFGSGMTTATLLGSPNLKRVDTIEIEPAMVEGARLFGTTVDAAYTDPRSRIVIDDAKSYFARSNERYDLIISEPSNPWVSGVASLFTVEFYQRVKRQLVPGGIFVQWIQTYEFNNELMATILRALDQEFADFAVYSSNGGDMILVASTGKLPAPSEAFARFRDLRPTLDRLSMTSLDELEARRLVGAQGVRGLLARMSPTANSDYYPLVDLGAPRARFIGQDAVALTRLPMAPLPIVEMLERRTSEIPAVIAPGKAQVERREAIHAAKATQQWLLTGATQDANPVLPRDVGLLRAHLWSCAALPPRVQLSDLFREVAVLVNTHLPPLEAARVWVGVRNAPCARLVSAEDLQWLALFEAVGARDAEAMSRLGAQQAASIPSGRLEIRGYAVLAATTGLLVTGRTTEAARFLEAELAKLPASSAREPIFMVLLGLAARPPV
jgi:spermidine synthase